MKLRSYFSFSLFALGLSTSAFAATYTWSGTGGTLGTVGGISNDIDTLVLTASSGSSVSLEMDGYTTANKAINWELSTGTGTITRSALTNSVTNYTGDVGLVIANGINSNSFVQFNPFAVLTNITSIVITLTDNTSTGTATYDIWDSNTAGKIGNASSVPTASNLLATGTDSSTSVISLTNISALASYPYLAVSGGDCDVLISKIVITTSSTPEPSTLAFGLIGVVLVSTRKLYQRFARKQA